MLNFETQKKLLTPYLNKNQNHLCADCNTISPTWVSLDFGVFLCSNCSGAHRGLGPTITRVRSTNLDKWNEAWIDNMKIGNTQINKYWEANSAALQKKPHIGASHQEISRYVHLKYIKRKWVLDTSVKDPLAAYKCGQLQLQKQEVAKKPTVSQPAKKIEKPKLQETPKKQQPKKQQPKQEITLLDFEFDAPPTSQPQPVQQVVQQAPQVEHQEDEFTDYTEAGTSFTNQTSNLGFSPNQQVNKVDVVSDGVISFDDLMKKKSQVPHQNHHQQHQYVMPGLHHSHSAQSAPHHNGFVMNGQQQMHFHNQAFNPHHQVMGHHYQPQPSHLQPQPSHLQPQPNHFQAMGIASQNMMGYAPQVHTGQVNGQVQNQQYGTQGSLNSMWK